MDSPQLLNAILEMRNLTFKNSKELLWVIQGFETRRGWGEDRTV